MGEQIIGFNYLDFYHKPSDFGERQYKSVELKTVI